MWRARLVGNKLSTRGASSLIDVGLRVISEETASNCVNRGGRTYISRVDPRQPSWKYGRSLSQSSAHVATSVDSYDDDHHTMTVNEENQHAVLKTAHASQSEDVRHLYHSLYGTLQDYATFTTSKKWMQTEAELPDFMDPHFESREEAMEESADIPNVDAKIDQATRNNDNRPSIPSHEENVDAVVDKDNALKTQLLDAIKKRKEETAVRIFDTVLKRQIDMDEPTLRALFYLVTESYPFHAYQLLHLTLSARMKEEQNTEDIVVGSLYKRMCESLKVLNIKEWRQGDIRSLVGAVISELKQLDPKVQERCYPILLSSLLQQKSTRIGRWAFPLYQYMSSNNIEMSHEHLEHLLGFSSYNRPRDLPYHEILQKIVDEGYRPNVRAAMNVLENLFPYMDVDATYIALKAIYDLQKSATSDERYVIDIATLECIAAAAARTGNLQLNFLVWDCVDVLGYRPTAALFESSVVCFSLDDDHFENTFVAMTEMEEQGFEVSRALIRNVSTKLRNSVHRLEMGQQASKNAEFCGAKFSPSCLNLLLSAHGERGDVEKALSLLEEFKRNGWSPNVHSFSFALEALGRSMARRRRRGEEDIHFNTANKILSMMEDYQVEPNVHVIRNYVEFLCLTNRTETATMVVLDALEKESSVVVDSKTIYRVAMANAENGDFETARELSSRTNEPLPFLNRKIQELWTESISKNFSKKGK